jgi:hypothetical protein
MLLLDFLLLVLLLPKLSVTISTYFLIYLAEILGKRNSLSLQLFAEMRLFSNKSFLTTIDQK